MKKIFSIATFCVFVVVLYTIHASNKTKLKPKELPKSEIAHQKVPGKTHSVTPAVAKSEVVSGVKAQTQAASNQQPLAVIISVPSNLSEQEAQRILIILKKEEEKLRRAYPAILNPAT